MTISQRVSDVRSRLRAGRIGHFVDTTIDQMLGTVINRAPQTKQIGTVVVDTAADDTDYTVTIAGIDITIDSGTGATKITIAAALALAIAADPIVRGLVSAESDGVDTVTVTGLWPGVAFTMEDADANLTTAEETTAAAEGDPIPFGRLVIFTGVNTPEYERLGAVALASLLTAQADVHTVAFVAAATYPWQITVDGQTYSGIVAADTDTATTATAIADAINAALPANTVAATADAGDVTLTAETAGRPFVSSIGSSAAAGVTGRTTNTALDTDVNRAAAGVALFGYDEEDEEYPANAGARIARRGSVWVDNAESPAVGAAVYVELSAGDDSGKFYTTGGATRVRLNRATWGRSGSDDIAEIVFDFTRVA